MSVSIQAAFIAYMVCSFSPRFSTSGTSITPPPMRWRSDRFMPQKK